MSRKFSKQPFSLPCLPQRMWPMETWIGPFPFEHGANSKAGEGRFSARCMTIIVFASILIDAKMRLSTSSDHKP